MADRTYNLNGGFKPTMKRFADLEGPDFFPTPRWATFALIENEKFKGDIWECACGDGTMSRVLEETGCAVPSTDLYQRGYGEAGHDFSGGETETPAEREGTAGVPVTGPFRRGSVTEVPPWEHTASDLSAR